VALEPADLLRDYWHCFESAAPAGPILDLACGDGHNGIFLAERGFSVICCDVSPAALDRVRQTAERYGVEIEISHRDLEAAGPDPLPVDFYRGIVVFRYLHRPLIPSLKKSLKAQGVLIYETYTIEQPKFGKPRNPDYLLKPGELISWFRGWHIIHYFEGVRHSPNRAVEQIVCQKPA
jgi:SAM-dependent methyltransferase